MPSDLIRGWVPVRVKKTRQNKKPESLNGLAAPLSRTYKHREPTFTGFSGGFPYAAKPPCAR